MARRNADPYANYRFALELGSIQVAGFSECTGLSVETKIFEYKEGGRNETTLKFPESTTYGNVTLKKGVTGSTDLVSWILDVAAGSFDVNPRDGSTNISVILRNEKGDAVKRWNLQRAFPAKWTGPELKGAGNEVALETLELAHEGIEEVSE